MKFLKTLLVFPLVFMLGENSLAQAQRTMNFDGNTSLLLREFSAMLIQSEDQVQVEMKLGSRSATVATNSDELQRGDLILMMNGQRVSDVPGIRKMYEELPDGEEIKIGVRRGDERFIVSATKGDIPESRGQQMVMSFDSESDEPPVVLAELGILISKVEENIRIQALIDPILPTEFVSEDLQGFNIISLNGETFDTPEALQEYLSALPVGADLEIDFEKDGEEKTIRLKKPRARAGVSMGVDN